MGSHVPLSKDNEMVADASNTATQQHRASPGPKNVLKIATRPAVIWPLRGSLLLKHLDGCVIEPHHPRMHREQSPQTETESKIHHKRYHGQRKPAQAAESTWLNRAYMPAMQLAHALLPIPHTEVL